MKAATAEPNENETAHDSGELQPLLANSETIARLKQVASKVPKTNSLRLPKKLSEGIQV